jgi:hypothetical protein
VYKFNYISTSLGIQSWREIAPWGQANKRGWVPLHQWSLSPFICRIREQANWFQRFTEPHGVIALEREVLRAVYRHLRPDCKVTALSFVLRRTKLKHFKLLKSRGIQTWRGKACPLWVEMHCVHVIRTRHNVTFELSPSWEAASCAVTHELPSIL